MASLIEQAKELADCLADPLGADTYDRCILSNKDAAIVANIIQQLVQLVDDNPEWTKEDFKKAQPASAVVAAYNEGRKQALAQTQGVPVAWVINTLVGTFLDWSLDGWKPIGKPDPLYSAIPSIEAIRIETLEEAAKVCEEYFELLEDQNFHHAAAAIRSRK